jgi:hypothetical protein
MKTQVNDHQLNPHAHVIGRREAIWRKTGSMLLLLLGLTVSLTGTACTENDDDIDCGTPEWPCEEEAVVTDDSLEI